MFAGFLEANTSVGVTIGPFVDVGDGFTPETGVTLASCDEAELLKHESATVDDISGNTWSAVANMDGWYNLQLHASNVDTEGMLKVVFQDDSTFLPVGAHFQVLAQAAHESLFTAKDTGFMDVNTASITDGALTTAKFAASAITASLIAGSAIVAANFDASAIGAGAIAGNALTAGHFAASAIGAAAIAGSALTTDHLAGNAIAAGNIAASAITADKIAGNALVAGNFAASAIGAGAIAGNALTAGHFAASAIGAGAIAGNALTADHIAASAITAAKIAGSALVAANFDTDAIDANALAADAVDEIHDEVVEGTLTFRQAVRIFISALAGKSTGGGTANLKFRDNADAKDRIAATVDANGNRTAMTLDGT